MTTQDKNKKKWAFWKKILSDANALQKEKTHQDFEPEKEQASANTAPTEASTGPFFTISQD